MGVMHSIVQILGWLPESVLVVVVATLPVFELRGAIPLALGLGLSPGHAFLLSLIGNILPVLPMLYGLRWAVHWLERFEPVRRALEWVFARTQRRSTGVQKYGTLGLVLLVAIPLPTTGVWTATLAAFLFNIRTQYAFPAIVLGTVIAGLIVLGLGQGVQFLID